MLLAEEVLHAPTAERFRQAVRAVLSAPLPCSEELLQSVADRMADSAEGDATFDVAAMVGLRVVWVTDAARRRHCAIQALRRPGTPDADRSPAEILYASHVYRFTRAPDAAPLALVGCACGEIDTPAAIGWMGDRCGPCHDRTEAGEALPEPLGRHERRPLDGNALVGRTLAVRPDGRQALVLRPRRADEPGDDANVLLLWDLEDQREQARWATQGTIGVNFSPDGGTFALVSARDGQESLRLYDWPADNEPRVVLDLTAAGVSQPTRCFALSPHGRVAYFGQTGRVVRLPLGEELEVGPRSVPSDLPLDLACSADDRWLVVTWRTAGVVLYDRRTHAVAARNRVATLGNHGVLTFTPDGQVVCIADGQGAVWFFEVPTLRQLGRFEAGHAAPHGLDICGPWILIQAAAAGPIRCWPWERLVAFARRP